MQRSLLISKELWNLAACFGPGLLTSPGNEDRLFAEVRYRTAPASYTERSSATLQRVFAPSDTTGTSI
jgi:hypothetical protein